MKPFRNILTLLLSMIVFPVTGQVSIAIDDTTDTTGCDSLKVTFSVLPLAAHDTISEIRWEFGDGQVRIKDNADTVMYHYRLPGQYTPRAVINNNTSVTAGLIIKVYQSPDAYFSYSDTTISGTFSIVFVNVEQSDNTISYSYQWFLSKTIGDEFLNDTTTTGAGILVYPFDSEGLYIARLVVRSPVCSSEVSRVIEVSDTLDAPNVFSPNEDNINDQWIVRSNGKTVYSIKIFSRTGTLIYQSESPVIIWDGRNQSGQEMAPGTYYYVIEPVKPVKYSTRFKKAGFIQLFR